MSYSESDSRDSVSNTLEQHEMNEKPNEIDTSGVKSIAVVKKSIMAASDPPRFSQLSLDTNLNDPPSNWLRMRAIHRDHKVSNHREPQRRKQNREYSTPWMFPKQNCTLFSSFVIANNFPDYVGEVDVVSDAENIKKLLKIPFCNSHISMMVHRIGKTILLDEFDIHSHLLRASKKEWQWLKKFYYDHLTELQENEKKCLRKNKSRGYLQYKNMLSKFLYHSVMDEELTKDIENDSEKTEDFHEEEQFSECNESSSPIRMPSLASITFQGGSTVEQLVPRSAEEIDPGKEHHEFLRNVLWTFEDIRMLIGSDLPIFGGGTHPVVSLRLRDMNKPINVLTGLDYWLDNLMCNVPEVVMCYHLDGIVQKYELLKTEDIPQMSSESKFSPKLVKDIAQNLLSFLKSKATKSGHTYWLLKGKHDDVVKLYDLTTLLDKEETSQDDTAEKSSIPAQVQKRNPFTLPVAMLLYRVAINMKESKQGKNGTVFKLLSNCLMLIDKNTHPQVAASAHYLLSELYFPNNLEPNIVHQSYHAPFPEDCEDSSQSSSDESDEGGNDSHKQDDSKFSVDVKSLCRIPGPCTSKEGLSDAEKNLPSFGHNWLERCTRALEEVVKGLQCIALKLRMVSKPVDNNVNNSATDSNKKAESQKLQFARPNESIPLPFTPLNAQKETAVMSPKQNTGKNYCKTMLLLKAVQIYGALGEIALQSSYGRALQCVKLGLCCNANLTQTVYPASANYYVSHLLGLAGDAHIICMRKDGNRESALSIDENSLQANREEFDEFSTLDNDLKEHLLADLESEYKWCYTFPQNMEEALNLGQKCYKAAITYFQKSELKSSKKDTYMSLTRRLANVCNELGIFYMNEGILIWNKTGVLNEIVSSLWKNSEEHLTSALNAFRETKDEINSALLNSNLARLMRLCASACHTLPSSSTNTKTKPLTTRERRYHQKAIHYYQKAINILKDNKMEMSQLWERIHWDLCCTLFTKGTQMQDYPPLENVSQEQIESEIISSMQKALELCDIDWGPSWQPVYQYRAATIHHRLGSLYHNTFRNKGSSDHHRKQLKQQAETHYAKAANLYEIFGNPKEYVSVLLKWMSLREATMTAQTGAKSKMRTIHSVLEIAVKSKIILQQIVMKDKPKSTTTIINDSVSVATEDDEEDLDSLLVLLCQSLIKLLKDLCKFQRSNKAMEKKLDKAILILEKKDNGMENISSALDIIEKTLELKN